jgi:hypothetical protein
LITGDIIQPVLLGLQVAALLTRLQLFPLAGYFGQCTQLRVNQVTRLLLVAQGVDRLGGLHTLLDAIFYPAQLQDVSL